MFDLQTFAELARFASLYVLPCVGPGACVMQIHDLEVLARRFAIKVGLNIGVLTDEK